jgi:two-component system OmpR family response regulator/two-component system response regulator QseB
MHLLIVEDDALLGGALSAALGKAGFGVTWVKEGRAALDALHAQPFAAVVLDIGLPGLSGLDVLRSLRADGLSLPVLMLTARDTTRDKVLSLECGADDHVVKTAEIEELVARLRALIRRSGRGPGTLSVGELTLDPDSRSVTHQGQAVSLSRREFDVLRALMEAGGRVLTRAQLEQSLYGWNGGVESNAVEVHISNLRSKLGPAVLKTVRGVGYAITAPGP